MDPAHEHVVVIGASAGGVSALLEISRDLPALFAAPVCIVQHIGNNPSVLPELLRFRGANHAVHAHDGQRLASGTLHVAPPDHHVLVDGPVLRVVHGAKENHARPAIDPLFRTAAASWGPRVIGVILTGQMDDGAAGLKAVQQCGGVAIVQDPASAAEPEMPRSALAAVRADHCVPLAEIAPLLHRLVGTRTPPPALQVPPDLLHEVAINQGDHGMERVSAIGTLSALTCPECGGGLWELNDRKPLRYRCHTGHAFTSVSLRRAQQQNTEQALWSSLRALREREVLLRRVANVAAATGDQDQAAAGLAQAERLRRQMEAVRAMVETAPADPELDESAA